MRGWFKVALAAFPLASLGSCTLGEETAVEGPMMSGIRSNLHAHQPIPWNHILPYREGLLFMDFDNVTLPSQKPCQHNNMFDCSETKGCNIPQ